MMTSSHCLEQAELCDARAAASTAATHAADWRQMATQWRSLAKDGDAQGTVARLMAGSRRP
jgi:hypothetical protein